MSAPFIHDDFLLQTKTARRLYHEFAENQPILDYHNHLPPEDIANNRQFSNLFEIWLEGDHYKWRAMRANGVPEESVTGNGDPFDKFLAFAKTVPHTLRNPLYHWTHLELKRYFGIDELLDGDSAKRIWDRANEQLATPEFSAREILKRWDVRGLCTTDDPTSNLAYHKSVADDPDFNVGVFPTFRPDKALGVTDPASFNAWTAELAAAAGADISSYSDFKNAIRSRHDFFHELGGRLSDHGLNHCFADFCTDEEAAGIFDRARSGSAASPAEYSKFATAMMLFFGELDAERGWTKQMHVGAMRNNNGHLFKTIGTDIGCDSIGDWNQGEAMSGYLGRLSEMEKLPQVVIYNLNPAHNYLFATMAGNFKGVQFGSGWWFLDQKEAMEWQMNALSNCGLLSKFVGMLTDSRSFMSFPRHEYFRRTLCNLIGSDAENGLIPNDDALLGPMVENICFANAQEFLKLGV
ncbi:MAG: glucuronate isomerase [Verrucomicrobiales bacterium]|nr:glucuronate isomerase [Verrucomicrobiales bacterium]